MQKYLDFKNEINYIKLKGISDLIKNGEIVVFPTETVYGIGVNTLDEDAVKRLYDIKKRTLNKPISLLVNSINMIEQVAKDITELEYSLIKEFLPGPLTIILKKKDIVPNIVTAGNDTVGIRIPANDIAIKLIEYSGVPIATSSANITGKPSGIELSETMKDFEYGVGCFIDGGKSKIGLASTIVQVIDGIPHILREGSISKEEIEKVCRKYKN